MTTKPERIVLGKDLGEIVIPAGYKFLDAEQSETVLTELWGNPPSGENPTYGMLFPENAGPMSDGSYAVNITYTKDGYVSDEDAEDLDYDELLESMQEGSEENNSLRKEQGYPAIDLIGWAATPFYDKNEKKLHWAKELRFEGMEQSTLNYNIRVLGRNGYFELNFISDMTQLETIKQETAGISSALNFKEGHKYSEFDPDMDKVAAYGIGGLIAGKILAKAGFFAVIAKFWKIILLGLAGLFPFLKRFLGKKK